jgi:hypothetical protein
MAEARQKYSASVNATKAEVDANNAVRVFGIVLLNNVAAIGYLQMFFKPAASVTVGTTTPDMVIPLPSSGGLTLSFPDGWLLGGSGLTLAGTTTRTGSTNNAIDVVLVMG